MKYDHYKMLLAQFPNIVSSYRNVRCNTIGIFEVLWNVSDERGYFVGGEFDFPYIHSTCALTKACTKEECEEVVEWIKDTEVLFI